MGPPGCRSWRKCAKRVQPSCFLPQPLFGKPDETLKSLALKLAILPSSSAAVREKYKAKSSEFLAANKQAQANISLTTSSARLASERFDHPPAPGTHAHKGSVSLAALVSLLFLLFSRFETLARSELSQVRGTSFSGLLPRSPLYTTSSLACKSPGHFNSCQHHQLVVVVDALFIRPGPRVAQKMRPPSVNFESWLFTGYLFLARSPYNSRSQDQVGEKTDYSSDHRPVGN